MGREAAPADPQTWFWDRHAQSYDQTMELLERPIRRMIKLAGAAVRGRARVLEVAAGTGLMTPVLAYSANEVVATDYAARMVEQLHERVRAEELSNVTVELADLFRLRFDAGSFDAVVAANVLHVVPDFPEALAGLRRVLAPSGVLVVPTFCHADLRVTWRLSRALAFTGFPGARICTEQMLAEGVREAGLQVQAQELIPGPSPHRVRRGRARLTRTWNQCCILHQVGRNGGAELSPFASLHG